MKRFIVSVILPIFLATIFLASCASAPQTKEQYLTEYTKFVKDIEKNKDSYTDEQWEAKDKEFEKFEKELFSQFEDDLGMAEKRKARKLASDYKASKGVDIGLNGLLDGLGDLNINLDGINLDDAISSLTDAFEGQDMQTAIDGFAKQFENADFEGLEDIGKLFDAGNTDEALNALSKKLEGENVDELMNKLQGILNSDEAGDLVGEISGIFNDDIKREFENVYSNLKNEWGDKIAPELKTALGEIKESIDNGEMKAEIEKGKIELKNASSEIRKAMDDEKIQESLLNKLDDMKKALESLEAKLDEQ